MYNYHVDNLMQGELEHRTPKSRYKRTDKKTFVKQLTEIERREARIRRIRMRLGRARGEQVPRSLEEHHHIGKSQNEFEHIGTFLRRNSGDPATKVRVLSLSLRAYELKQPRGCPGLPSEAKAASPSPYYCGAAWKATTSECRWPSIAPTARS